MKVKGQLINISNRAGTTEAEIELSPPTKEQIGDLKKGDEVLIKAEVGRLFGGAVVGLYFSTPTGHKKDIAISLFDIATILTSQPEFCKCENEMYEGICFKCNKPIRKTQPEVKKEIEPIDNDKLQTCKDPRAYLAVKIDQCIHRLNSMEGR